VTVFIIVFGKSLLDQVIGDVWHRAEHHLGCGAWEGGWLGCQSSVTLSTDSTVSSMVGGHSSGENLAWREAEGVGGSG